MISTSTADEIFTRTDSSSVSKLLVNSNNVLDTELKINYRKIITITLQV